MEYISGWDGPGVGAVMADGGSAVWVAAGDVPRALRTLTCAWRVIDADDPAQPTIAEWIAVIIYRAYHTSYLIGYIYKILGRLI